MIRAFLDTNILVSATFWQGASYKLLLEIAKGTMTGFTSPDVLEECRKVLKRDFSMNEKETDAAIEKLLQMLFVVSPSQKLDIIREDPADNRILEGALEAKTDVIVSYDWHILKLGKFGEIEVIRPEELLARLKQ